MVHDDTSALGRILSRGEVTDRPWGETLAALARARHSGQLSVRTRGGQFQIAIAGGVVVGARSPVAADAVARVALAARWIPPAIARTVGKVDDLGRVARAGDLSVHQVEELERRVLTQRTARTFAVEFGAYAIHERVTLPTTTGRGIDLRATIYAGLRLNLPAQRLTATLRSLGTRFALRAEDDELRAFGFGPSELPVLDALREGTSLPELEIADRAIDPRMAEAVLCALALCGATVAVADVSTVSMARAPTPRAPTISRVPTPRAPTVGRVPTPREPTVSRTPTPRAPTMSAVPFPLRQAATVAGEGARSSPRSARPTERARPPVRPPAVPVARAPSRPPPVPPARAPSRPPGVPPPLPPSRPPTRAMTDRFLEVQPTKMRPPALHRDEVVRLIEVGANLLACGVDHFTYLGLPWGASVADVRDAYLEFARYLRPDRLEELGIVDEGFDAGSVFAQVIIAFTVLTDPARRADYMATLRPQAAPPDHG